MVDVGLHHRAIDPELAPAGDLQRPRQLDGAVVEWGDGLATDRIGPAYEGGVVGSLLQIQPAELPQDYGVVDEAPGLFVAESVEPLYHGHSQDNLHRCGAASELPGVCMAAGKIRFDPLEEDVVIEQPIKLSQFGLELKVEFGDHLEEVYGVVSIDCHGGQAPVLWDSLGHRNPTEPAHFAPETI